MTTIGVNLSAIIGAAFIAIGILAVLRPAALSHLYGLYVHEKNGRGFVRATGIRDVAFGVLLIYFAYQIQGALAATLAVGAGIAISDFLTVWRTSGRFELPFLGGHIAGAILLAGTATIVGMSTLSR